MFGLDFRVRDIINQVLTGTVVLSLQAAVEERCMLSGKNCPCLACVNCPTFLLPCNVYMAKNSTGLLTITLHTQHLPDSRQTTGTCK